MSALAQNLESLYPLSPMQQGMLFHSLSAPESGMYVEQMTCRLRGRLDISSFQRAWQTVVDRHPALRTAFIVNGPGEPVQVVLRESPAAIEILNGAAKGRLGAMDDLEAILDQDRRKGFDLSKPPLIRLTLMPASEKDTFFIWSYHHLLLDGWSVPLVLHEVMSYYESMHSGRELRLPVPRPYREYIVWLRKQNRQQAEAFWRKTLEGFEAPTPLPLDGFEIDKDSARRGPEGMLELWVEPDDTERLQSTARRYHLTLSTLIQGAWALLLSRYSAAEDVVFGVTVSGRPPEIDGVESMVGLFINTLPMRVRLRRQDSVSSFLHGLQKLSAAMRQYEYSSLVEIQGWSSVPRGTPLFESILVYENYPVPQMRESEDRGLEIDYIGSAEKTNFPLTLVGGLGEKLMLKIHYDAGRFNSFRMQRMLAHLGSILTVFGNNPETLLGEVGILTGAEKSQVFLHWNDTAGDFPQDRCLHELFEEQALRSPSHEAVIFEGNRISYAELDRRANRLANYLRKQGVGPEVLVGICLERSIEMVVAVLGVMKAGGAYVPLDPELPSDRLGFMLADTAIEVIVAQEATVERLPVSGQRILRLDSNSAGIEIQSEARPTSGVLPQNLAYVIYTSGSTGTPKGVQLQHQGVVNFIHVHIRALGVGAGHRILQFAAFSFDASVSEIFTALLSGAALCLARPDVWLSQTTAIDFLRAEAVTMAVLPPSLLALLSAENLPALRIIISAGEACSPEIAARWAKGRRFLNGYGPTEASVGPLLHEVKEIEDSANVPIGRPLANLKAYILDPSLQPLPGGVTGELWVGGAGLSRGYLGRPDMTAIRFMPDPFSAAAGARIYRTGDLARNRADGTIEFLGRVDHQVKIRGFRVELGEIESALQSHPRVRQAAVALQASKNQAGDLIAYVVPESDDETVLPGSLRAYLKERLPRYMLPARYVLLEKMPLNPSGKVDRRALPEPDQTVLSADRVVVGPRDAIEVVLIQIWEDLLQIQPVGVKDNFFELGGHSLLGIRLMAQLREKFQKEISLVDFFQDPTVENLACVMRRQDIRTSSTSLVPLQPKGSAPALFLVHPSGGRVHWYLDLARRLDSRPVYGLQARGVETPGELHTTVIEMASHYIKAMREIRPHGPYHLGSWSMGVVIAFEMALQLQAAGEPVGLLALLDQGPDCPAAEPEDHAAYLVEVFGKQLPLSLDLLRLHGPEEQLAQVWKTAREAQWLFPEVTLDQFKRFVEILRLHTDAMRRYNPGYYSGRITLFRAGDQTEGGHPEQDMGWGYYAAGGVDVRMVPGDHLSMMQEPSVQFLAKEIEACLSSQGGDQLITARSGSLRQ